MRNKIVGLSLAMMLGFGMVGCGSTEVKEPIEEPQYIPQEEYIEEQPIEEPQYIPTPQEEEQPIDEDLNDEYFVPRNELEEAKELIEVVAEGTLDSTRYDIVTLEDSNSVVLRIHLDEDVILQGLVTDEWRVLVTTWTDATLKGKEAFDVNGLKDVNFCVTIGDIDQNSFYFSAMNGTVIYDAQDKLN